MYVFRLFLILTSVTLVAVTSPSAPKLQQEPIASTKRSIEINQLLMNDALQKVGADAQDKSQPANQSHSEAGDVAGSLESTSQIVYMFEP